MKHIKNGCVNVGDTNMYYVSFGKGEKILVVLPGLSDGLATVKGKGRFLVSPYKKYLKDYTIYIFSRKNNMKEGYSIRQMADDQVIAMRNLGIKKANICGVSQGGMIAQYIAIDHPDVVEKLILGVTAPSCNDIVKDAVSSWIEMAKNKNHKELMIDTARRMYSNKYLEKNRKLFPILAFFTKPKSYNRFFINANAILSFNAKYKLDMIKSKTLIIAGEDDKTVGNYAKNELNMGIKNSELFVYDGLGHGAFEEAKDFYDRIFEFLNKQ